MWRRFQIALAVLALLPAAVALADEEPPLPDGLDDAITPLPLPEGPFLEPILPDGLGDVPPLPAGLASDSVTLPALPDGLDDLSESLPSDGLGDGLTPEFADHPEAGLMVTGFMELRYGRRTEDDPRQDDDILSEARLHVEAETDGAVVFKVAADILADLVERQDIDLRAGEGPIDLREATVFFRPAGFADVKLGRQIATWGTGDLLFINDIFPKDFESFLAGRDDDYLKAPIDAARVSLFFEPANMEFVLIPIAVQDRLVDGTRISFTHFDNGQLYGGDDIMRVNRRDTPEAAMRVYRNFGAVEAAAYGFWGRWKRPADSSDPSGLGTFPRLNVYGASLRGPLWGGIANFETGYYHSRDDVQGTDSAIANSEWRAMAGFEREIWSETTLGLQYYVTRMEDYRAFKANLGNAVDVGRYRDIATMRLTRLMLDQTLTGSLFLFHSPTDGDGHLRLRLDYQVDDDWSLGSGVNLFYGDWDTPFGQFEKARSFMAYARYGF